MNEIIWSADAGNDFLEIISYTVEHFGKVRTKETYGRIIEKIDKLSTFSNLGKINPELKKIGISEIREIVESPWRIFYKIEESVIYIVSIIDSRRNIEELLYKKVIDGKIQ